MIIIFFSLWSFCVFMLGGQVQKDLQRHRKHECQCFNDHKVLLDEYDEKKELLTKVPNASKERHF